MKALSMIGLVEAHPGRGTVVLPDALKVLSSEAFARASLGDVDLEEVHEARAVIERAVTGMAAERAEPDDISEIEEALQEMQANVGKKGGVFAMADMRFHLAVARASKNQILAQLYFLTRSLLEPTVEQVNALPGVKERALHCQEEMLEAIKSRDTVRAKQAALRHSDDIEAFLLTGQGVEPGE